MTTLNLDLLTKLVKLANNNPNDNEANLAARKVCQLIEAAGFKFSVTQVVTKPPVTTPQNPTPPPYKSADAADFRRRFYDEYKKQNPNVRYKSPYNYIEYDDFSFFGRDQDYMNIKYETVRKTKQYKSKRNLKCKICKEEKETMFLGLEELYECNDCQWANYLENKKK